VREGIYLVSPSVLTRLFRRLTSTTLQGASKNSSKSVSSKCCGISFTMPDLMVRYIGTNALSFSLSSLELYTRLLATFAVDGHLSNDLVWADLLNLLYIRVCYAKEFYQLRDGSESLNLHCSSTI